MILQKNAQIKLVLAIAKGRGVIRISVQKLDFRTELKMINDPFVYDSGALGTNLPDFKAFFDRPTPTKTPSCQESFSRRRLIGAEGTRIINKGIVYHF